MRIAVVGGGISGMLAARLLADEHEVHLLEADGYVGGHTHTVDVEVGGNRYAADTGFMVFNDRTYPDFVRMLKLLGVASRASDMSFSVRCDRTGLEYQGGTLSGLFAQRRNLFRPSFYRMLRDILRFNREAPGLLNREGDTSTLDDYLRNRQYSAQFVEHYLAPMGAAIWSTPPGRFRQFPARYTVGFFRNHGLLQLRDRPQWQTVVGGAVNYVEALLRPLANRVRLNYPVQRVRRQEDHVVVTPRGGEPEVFDRVVLAAHADQSLAMLVDPSPAEKEILGAIPYQANQIVLHTDTRLLPKTRRAWASWNCHLSSSEQPTVTLTYNLNRLQGHRSEEPILETLNPTIAVDPAKVLDRMTYHHPVYSVQAIEAQRRYREINGQRGTYYCGAYWGHGFHEAGVRQCFGRRGMLWEVAGIMQSRIYEGRVRHRRFSPVEHRFGYGLSLLYLDLDEIPQLLRGGHLLFRSRFSPGSFCRDDHLGAPGTPLADAVRELVAAETGERPKGPIRLLTQLRRYGHYFSPLNLYYCFDRGGEDVEVVVAEVSNTPWRQRHCYVLWRGNRVGPGDRLRFRHRKGFHVSPFMDMDFDYHWQLNTPAETLKVVLASHQAGERVFVSDMVLRRRPLTRGRVFRSWLRFPWMTAQVVSAIYFEAFRLWMKKCPYFPHPGTHQGTSQ